MKRLCDSSLCRMLFSLFVPFAVALTLAYGSLGSTAVAQTEAAVDTAPVVAPVPRDAVFAKPVPVGIEDLRIIENRVKALVKQLQLATVGVRNGRAAGSGVIVSKDGFVLTAAHVCVEPGRNVTLILSDGRRVKGKTLGTFRGGVDAGLMKITEKGDWPVAEMGSSKKLKLGDWCIATGHPGGFDKNRAPVVRLGRVVLNRRGVIQTDCTLVGGDSGGPLYDIDGKVIGINSRIGANTNWNFHVPVSQFSDNWDRLVAAEDWGGDIRKRRAVIGINGEDHDHGCLITGVAEGLPAAQAGLKKDDIITKLEGKPIKGIGDLAKRVGSKKPGDKVKIEILRGEETLEMEVTLVKPND
ncbi:MAG: PDZ domain-containing protein [Planctomycetaceae bacterium]|jgi:serine protease Do|nr:PDZ domain-containing protein [Planctomycetaceae bacterium]MBT6155794.1 PDZ domain-containing protein [Planctomycetaceae bacterium]MBT6485818.1 PDZ domain-containing protein [Planctomycetaceae bacterium]MBT6493996.1 PDZ domain-containing protein [Planctomycetaceae bacterium]